MKASPKSLPLRVYALLLLIVFGGVVITAPVTVFLGTVMPDVAIIVKAWKEILLGAALLLAIGIVTKCGLWRELLGDWALRLSAVYALLHVVLMAWHWQGMAAAGAGILIDLRYVLMFVLTYVLIKVAPWYRLPMLIVGACGAMVVVIFGFLQQFLPRDILAHIGYNETTIQPYLTVDKNPDYVRINSTLRGPNPLGAYVGTVLTMMAAICARQAHRFKNWRRVVAFIVVALCALTTLWTSYSRSALVGSIVALAIVVVIAWGKTVWAKKGWLALGVSVMLICGVILASQSSFVDNVIRHDNPATGAKITSDQAHVSSLKHGVTRLLQQPLGAGIGTTGSASLFSDKGNIIENQYLFVAHETGWLGLGLFGAIIGLVLRRAWRDRRDWLALGVFAGGIGLLLIGLLLPVFADDTVSIVWWGLAGIVYARVQSEHNDRKSSYKKTASNA